MNTDVKILAHFYAGYSNRYMLDTYLTIKLELLINFGAK